MRPLISLVMIVKDEAARIRETLLSARAYVDRYTIVDTGSTDRTIEIARKAMRDMPGQIVSEPFVDFATTRNRALEIDAAAEDPAVFTLFLSGDEVLCEGRALREFLETQRDSAEDAFNVTIKMEGKSWPYPRVLRTGSAWRYEGRVHEQPMQGGKMHPPDGASVPRAFIRHDVSDQERRLTSMLSVHVPLLEEALNENPEDGWALFYLADTLAHLAEHVPDGVALTWRMQAMSYLYRRSMIQDGAEDVIRHCLLAYLEIATKTGLFTPQEVHQRVEALCRRYPDYPEAQLLGLQTRAAVTPRERMGEMIEAAIASASVAREAASLPRTSIPRNETCEWRSWFFAAQSAAFFFQQDAGSIAPDGERYEDKLARFVSAGIAAGGPELIFRALQKGAEDITGQVAVERGPAIPSA